MVSKPSSIRSKRTPSSGPALVKKPTKFNPEKLEKFLANGKKIADTNPLAKPNQFNAEKYARFMTNGMIIAADPSLVSKPTRITPVNLTKKEMVRKPSAFHKVPNSGQKVIPVEKRISTQN